ncbi:2,3-bisphosphoglycerate-independent phosphoglycerate mutase [Glycine max]|nr:2,3-bisphosphoglycerate-independent phosphoglycerate mutase [Glycine max]
MDPFDDLLPVALVARTKEVLHRMMLQRQIKASDVPRGNDHGFGREEASSTLVDSSAAFSSLENYVGNGLSKDYKAQKGFKYAAEDRCGVVVKEANRSGNIAGTCPLKDNDILLTARALDDSNEVRNTIAVVNELSKEMRQILLSHPANPKCAPGGKNIASVVLLGDSGI